MFFEQPAPSLVALWAIGFGITVAMAVLAFFFVARVRDRRWRHPKWAAFLIIVAGFVVVTQLEAPLQASIARNKLEDQVGLPVTYTAGDSSLTLNADGTAILAEVALADGVTRIGEGRRCLTGEAASVSGLGRWFMDPSGYARVEADDKVSRLYADPKPILGYGWRKGFLLTSCDGEEATLYMARNAD